MRQDREDQQIRQALEQLDAEARPHDLPSSAEVWSRLQFHLAYRGRKDNSTPDVSTLLVALYVLAFLIWTTWSGSLSIGLLAVLAAAGATALFLLQRVSRSFRN